MAPEDPPEPEEPVVVLDPLEDPDAEEPGPDEDPELGALLDGGGAL